jgi:hypothetical protein
MAVFQRKLATLPLVTYRAGETVLSAASTTGRLLILKEGALNGNAVDAFVREPNGGLVLPTDVSSGSILFLRFELLDECSEMRGDGSCEGVVLVLQALPNC